MEQIPSPLTQALPNSNLLGGQLDQFPGQIVAPRLIKKLEEQLDFFRDLQIAGRDENNSSAIRRVESKAIREVKIPCGKNRLQFNGSHPHRFVRRVQQTLITGVGRVKSMVSQK